MAMLTLLNPNHPCLAKPPCTHNDLQIWPQPPLKYVIAFLCLLTLQLSHPCVANAANPNQAIQADVLENIGDETVNIEEPASKQSTPSQMEYHPSQRAVPDDAHWHLDEDTESHHLDPSNPNSRTLFKRDTTGDPVGALLIIHDQNHTPDWPGPIRQLRRQLPNHGWSTLSIHIDSPQQATESLTNKTTVNGTEKPTQLLLKQKQHNQQILNQQIRSGFAFLNQQSLYNIVVIAEGSHASYTTILLKDVPSSSIAGFIALNIKPDALHDTKKVAEHMSKITAPVLDLIPEVSRHSQFARSRITKANQNAKTNYQQYTLPGTIEHFYEKNDFLIKRIRGWLKSNAGGMEAVLKTSE